MTDHGNKEGPKRNEKEQGARGCEKASKADPWGFAREKGGRKEGGAEEGGCQESGPEEGRR